MPKMRFKYKAKLIKGSKDGSWSVSTSAGRRGAGRSVSGAGAELFSYGTNVGAGTVLTLRPELCSILIPTFSSLLLAEMQLLQGNGAVSVGWLK